MAVAIRIAEDSAPLRKNGEGLALPRSVEAGQMRNVIYSFRIWKQLPTSVPVANGLRFPRLHLFRP